nr:pentapeptide repeat-containing protein [Streptomyces sp. NBC_00857]
MPRSAITQRLLPAAFTGVIVIAGWLLWHYLPALAVFVVPMLSPYWDSLTPGEKVTALGQFRLTVVQGTTALGAGIALYYTSRTFRLNRRGQVTDRFTKALERLGSDELYVRLGGVLALEQIVQDSPEQSDHAAQVLATFVRLQAPPVALKIRTVKTLHIRKIAELIKKKSVSLPEPPADDVQAALTALTRPDLRRHPRAHDGVALTRLNLRSASLENANLHGFDLSESDLSHAYLQGADLSEVSLYSANLRDAMLGGALLSPAYLDEVNLSGASLCEATLVNSSLDGANLSNARLEGANISGADMRRSNLSKADCYGANFTFTKLSEANLDGADLRNADLRRARGLRITSLLQAKISSTTKLPDEIAADRRIIKRIAEVEEEQSNTFEMFRR